MYPVFEVTGLKFGINNCYDTNFPEEVVGLANQQTLVAIPG